MNEHPSAARSILRKVLITTFTGGLAYLITNTAQESQIWSITLSAFIGSVVLVIQFLIDFESRLGAVEQAHDRHAQSMERLVNEGFTKISEATELFGLIEASPLGTDLMLQLVRNSVRIKPGSPSLVFDFAKAEITRMAEFLKELSDGAEVTYDGEDRDWLLALARNARTSIDATSFSTSGGKGGGRDAKAGGSAMVDEGLWNTDLGQRYLEAQRDAVERKVTIRRLFILDSPDLSTDPEVVKACRAQREIGVQVRILYPSAVPAQRRSQLLDFIIFDNVICYELTSAPRIGRGTSTVIANTRLVLTPHRVAERAQGFKDLWAAAHEFDESKAGLAESPPDGGRVAEDVAP
ncbi:MAG: phosphatidylserine/phosphatidylglycerophosphate/cardiolipin synthase family protein [Micromonosporaceae bacterium]|jgi:hypothetical protein|nr:phosphatidylserine/phosphatidylglycerophosphate/cardiolipin synthase family protein [Micromonosporaceae bacterium]